MAITQHPSSDWLSSYAAGSLPLSQSLCVAAHLEHCEICQQNVARLNQLGGELMSSLDHNHVHDIDFDSFMGKLEQSAEQPQAPHHHKYHSSVPNCLQRFIPNGYQQLKWSWISPSIHSAELCRDHCGTKVELLKIKPAGKAPTHTHLGDELTVILEGSFSDENGVYKAGDFMVCNSSHKHTPVASKDRECICLVVSQAPIQFSSWFGQLLNPLLRRGYS